MARQGFVAEQAAHINRGLEHRGARSNREEGRVWNSGRDRIKDKHRVQTDLREHNFVHAGRPGVHVEDRSSEAGGSSCSSRRSRSSRGHGGEDFREHGEMLRSLGHEAVLRPGGERR